MSFFYSKRAPTCSKKETFCMKKIASYLLRFCKTNSRPLLKKNTYLHQKKEILIGKLKTVLPAVILKKKKSRPLTSQNFKTHKTFVVQRFLSYKYTLTHKLYTILLSRDLKTKKVRHHPHPQPTPTPK